MGLDNPIHIVFLILILLLVFGAKRLPEIGRSLGSGMREFKESVTGQDKATLAPMAQPTAPAPAPPAPAAVTAEPARQAEPSSLL